MAEQDDRFRVTTRDLWQLLNKVSEDVTVIKTKVEDVNTRVNDHESRLRSLEAWRYALPTSMVFAIASTIATAIMYFHR